MAWVFRIVISAMAAIVSGISMFFGVIGIALFYGNELAQLPLLEPGSFGDILYVFILAGYSVLLGGPLMFLLFLIFYKRLNLLGLLLGAGFGFWFIRVAHLFNITHIASYENREEFMFYLNTISFVCLLLGAFFVKRDTERFSRAGTVFGAMVGFLGSFVAVIGWRRLDNTLTSYFNFDSTESAIVVIGVLVFAVIGNVADKKYSWHLTKKHKESIG